MKDLELKCSEMVEDLESIGLYGLGYFAGLLVEYRPNLAAALVEAIKLNQEEIES
jgi:hypothetical protein